MTVYNNPRFLLAPSRYQEEYRRTGDVNNPAIRAIHRIEILLTPMLLLKNNNGLPQRMNGERDLLNCAVCCSCRNKFCIGYKLYCLGPWFRFVPKLTAVKSCKYRFFLRSKRSSSSYFLRLKSIHLTAPFAIRLDCFTGLKENAFCTKFYAQERSLLFLEMVFLGNLPKILGAKAQQPLAYLFRAAGTPTWC